MLKIAFIVLASELAFALECPDLTCASNFFNGTCFIHSGDSPVSSIKLYSCQDNQKCNIEDNNYAWYETELQLYQSGSALLSNLPNKYTTAYCVSIDSLRQNLNNGRKC